jgi:RNA-directed DNA polymerase
VKLAVATQALHKLRVRIRQLTRRVRGRSLEQIAEDLRGYVPGWKAYLRLALPIAYFDRLGIPRLS